MIYCLYIYMNCIILGGQPWGTAYTSNYNYCLPSRQTAFSFSMNCEGPDERSCISLIFPLSSNCLSVWKITDRQLNWGSATAWHCRLRVLCFEGSRKYKRNVNFFAYKDMRMYYYCFFFLKGELFKVASPFLV